MAGRDTPAHAQQISNRYTIMYPEHSPRTSDPHYKDFNAYHQKTKSDPTIYRCHWGVETGAFVDCGAGPLELHHSHIEFALANAIDLTHLEVAFPGVSNADEVGAWIETAANLIWLCPKHHRAQSGGIHHLSAADFEASKWLLANVIVPAVK